MGEWEFSILEKHNITWAYHIWHRCCIIQEHRNLSMLVLMATFVSWSDVHQQFAFENLFECFKTLFVSFDCCHGKMTWNVFFSAVYTVYLFQDLLSCRFDWGFQINVAVTGWLSSVLFWFYGPSRLVLLTSSHIQDHRYALSMCQVCRVKAYKHLNCIHCCRMFCF